MKHAASISALKTKAMFSAEMSVPNHTVRRRPNPYNHHEYPRILLNVKFCVTEEKSAQKLTNDCLCRPLERDVHMSHSEQFLIVGKGYFGSLKYTPPSNSPTLRCFLGSWLSLSACHINEMACMTLTQHSPTFVAKTSFSPSLNRTFKAKRSALTMGTCHAYSNPHFRNLRSQEYIKRGCYETARDMDLYFHSTF